MGSELVKQALGLDHLAHIETAADVKVALGQLDVLKAALEAADRFRAESVKFAMCEAYALVRAFEIAGDASLIKGKWRKLAAEWLAAMDEGEREQWIAKCEDGKTIDNVYRAAVAIPEQRNALADAVNDCRTEARHRLRTDGVVTVTEIVRRHSERFPKSMVKVITDGVRDAVRSAGGVGIGDENGTYIDPDKYSEYIGDALRTRIEAVARDIEGIADLANRCASKPEFRIKGTGEQLSFVDVTYIILAGTKCASVTFDSPKARNEAKSLVREIVGDVS